jgi:predicted Zn-dependent peptidase
MSVLKYFTAILFLLVNIGVHAQNKQEWKEAEAAGFRYKYVANDPQKVRFYTLKNGLEVIMHVNKKGSRVTYKMVVRAGSNNDPADHTGLAHYLEHLLFKGTDKYGTQNWLKEKPYLDQIEELYEVYNHTTDEVKRKEIYHKIDSVSGIAAQYAIANEYPGIMKEMGSQGTNAHTEFDATVYDENVPSGALDKLLMVQAERFRNPIFRLFHTELEAVYEEKNRGMDGDQFKVIETIFSSLYPNSNYGLQTTIGTVEHLKNPSLKAIKQFYDTYYVPNNMGLILSGDFNPDEAIKKVEKYFSYMQPKPLKEYQPAVETSLSAPMVKELLSPSQEHLILAFRVPYNNNDRKDKLLSQMLCKILFNGKAGLIDIDLIKQQKLQMAMIMPFATLKQYINLLGVVAPKAGQSLDEAKQLLLGEIQKVKEGNLEESLLTAVKSNLELELHPL